MIDKTVKQIEETVARATAMSPEKKDKLLALIGELKLEVNRLAETNREAAAEIADKSHRSARHATEEERDDDELTASIADLSVLVEKFEVSHPGLVAVVNSFCNALADLGI